MMQYMAQGACMAMEDAVALAGEMSAHGGDVEPALEAYRRRRVTRTARMQLQSRAVGEHIFHPDGVHAQVRNEIMRARSTKDWHDTLAWVYDGPKPRTSQVPQNV